MNKEEKNIIKDIKRDVKKDVKSRKLSKEDKVEYYNDIYHIYGTKIYREVAPTSIQKNDIKKLLKDGKFEDIYFKYGEETYIEKIDYMRARDIEYETGKKHLGVLSRIGNFVKKNVVAPLLGTALALPPLGAGTLAYYAETTRKEQELTYKEQIEEYIENTKEYGTSIRNMNLSQLEELMKLMDDMWKNIEGYGKPKIDLIEYSGLDLATQDGVGVCRNMADDIARKLNSIDGNYNARTLNVYMTDGGYKMVDIERKIIEDENESESTEEQENDNNAIMEKITKYTGNHKIVILDSREENATLVLDPTNLGIGVIRNNKINMFNSVGDNKLKLKVTPVMNFIQDSDRIELKMRLLTTFKDTKSFEQLQEKYSVEAQKEALESVRKKEETLKDRIKLQTKIEETIQINLSTDLQEKTDSKDGNDFVK